MEPELVGEHEPPHKEQNGVTNLLLSAERIMQVGRSGKAEGGVSGKTRFGERRGVERET